MSDTTQKRQTFKWGEQDYLLDDFLKAHSEQENYFYNFARDKGHFDDNAIALLRQAIASRVNHIKNGNNYSADGVLDTDRVQNIAVQSRKKGLFRKEQYTDQDVTEWAKYYVDQLLRKMSPHTPEDTSQEKAWDISKHGLAAYLTGQGLNAQEIFERFDKQDAENPQSARSYDQRRAHLRQYLPGYLDWLKTKGFDFSKNDNDWDDNYITDLESFIKGFDNLDINAITAGLRRFGAGDAYTTAYTSDRWDMSIPASQSAETARAQAEAEAERKRKEESDKAWQEERTRRYNIFSGLSDRRSGQISRYAGVDRSFDLTDEDLQYFLDNQKISGADAEKAFWDDYYARYQANPYDTEVSSLILPMKAREGLLGTIDSGDYAGWLYDPSTINEERQSVMAMNQETGAQEEIFIGNVKDRWGKIKKDFLTQRGDIDPMAAFEKDGGVLSMQTGGTFSPYDVVSQFKKDQNKARAAETGNTEEVQKARDRVVSTGDAPLTSADPTLASPDAGFTGAEKARLASIGMDIASLFLTPTAGAAVGITSSVTNLGADIADDGFQWGDIGNFAVNLGLDVLGWIPIVGDTLGTGTKLIKNLTKWAPRVMAGIAGIQGLANADGMLESWKKLTSGSSAFKMTVQDWRNIQQSITLITSGGRAIKNKVHASRIKKAAKVDDAVVVNVREKKSGETRQLFVNGEAAEQIRAAKGSKDGIEKVLNDLEGHAGKFGKDGDFEVQTRGGGLQMPIKRVEGTDGKKQTTWDGFRKEGRAEVSDVFDFKRVGTYDPRLGTRFLSGNKGNGPATQSHLQVVGWINGKPTNELDLRGIRTSSSIDADVAKLKTEKGVDAAIEGIKSDMTARGKQIADIDAKMPDRARLHELRSKLPAGDETTLRSDKMKMDQDIQLQQQKIDQVQHDLGVAEAELNNLLGVKKVSKTRKSMHEVQVQQLRDRVKSLRAELDSATATKDQLSSSLSTLEGDLKNLTDYQTMFADLKALQRQKADLRRSNHTDSYTRLEQLLADLRTSHANVGGRQMDWSMESVLKQAGLPNAFEQGGTINHNKINKFLKYVKG